MEIKKSSKADLDNRRTQGFLLGAILVLACCFVALEYDWDAGADDIDIDSLDEIVRELDLEALKKEEERIPLIKEPVAELPQSAEKVEVVPDEDEVKPVDLDEIAPPEQDVALKTVDESDDPEKPVAVDMESNPLNFRVVEELPEFPGGATELMKWLTKNLRYPASAQQRRQQGRVLAQFIVNTDGSLSDFKIVSPVSPDLDREALRVLRMMPPWKAGQQHQKPCRTMVCIPIVFKL